MDLHRFLALPLLLAVIAIPLLPGQEWPELTFTDLRLRGGAEQGLSDANDVGLNSGASARFSIGVDIGDLGMAHLDMAELDIDRMGWVFGVRATMTRFQSQLLGTTNQPENMDTEGVTVDYGLAYAINDRFHLELAPLIGGGMVTGSSFANTGRYHANGAFYNVGGELGVYLTLHGGLQIGAVLDYERMYATLNNPSITVHGGGFAGDASVGWRF